MLKSNFFSQRRNPAAVTAAAGAETGAKFVKRNLCIMVMMLLTGFLLLSCQEPETEQLSIDGTWISGWGERWVINLDSNTIRSDGESGGFEWFNYTADIHDIVYFTGSAGIIFIEYTETGTFWSKGEGNFTGVYFGSLTDTTVEIADASEVIPPDTYITPAATTLALAKSKFTAGTINEYFAITSACVRE